MLNPMPYNVVPFFLIGLSALFFGARGYARYRKTRTPLSYYFGVSGILAGLSAISYSLPFVFTYEELPLKVMTVVGDLFYYGAIIVTVRYTWYLGLNKSIGFTWLLIPLLGLIGINIILTIITIPDINYEVVNNVAHFPVAKVPSLLFAFLSISFVLMGYFTLRHARAIKESKQRFRLYIIGSVFTIGGISAIYNYLIVQGNNTSSAPVIGYSLAAIMLFAGVLFAAGKKNASVS